MSTLRRAGGVLLTFAGALALAGAGCGTGSVDIVLDMPQNGALAPTGAATIELIAQQLGDTPTGSTSDINDDGSFDLGKLPVVDGLALSVVLRSTGQRVVGFGEAPAPVNVDARGVIEVDVPVRRPFAYLTGPAGGLVALDTTLDGSQKYQSPVAVASGAATVAAAGADVWAIASSGKAVRISGSTHAPDGASVSLPSGVRDAVGSVDGRWLVAAVGGGLAIADTTSGQVTNVAVPGGCDRVAIGATADGGVRAVGLVRRVTPAMCPGSSQLAIVTLGDTLGSLQMIDPKVPLADIAGSDSDVDVVGVDPCGGALDRLTASGEITTATKLATVPAPTAAAMFGDHAWALGSVAGTDDGTGVTIAAGYPVLVDAAVDGSSSTRNNLAPVLQTAHGFDQDGNDLILSRDMNATTVNPDGLVVVPPGDQVAIVYDAHFSAPELDQGLQPVIPMMAADTYEYELLDATGGALVQRMLASCNLQYDGSQAAVPTWKCEPAAGASWAATQFTPGALAVLYGGR